MYYFIKQYQISTADKIHKHTAQSCTYLKWADLFTGCLKHTTDYFQIENDKMVLLAP